MAASFWSRALNAARAAWTTYNARALEPIEEFGWDRWDTYYARLFRYYHYNTYYTNTVYTDLIAYAATHKWQAGLYKHIRGIYNPVARLTDLYVAKVYGGQLDFQGLHKGAIPITVADDQLRTAISQVWKWSNWGQKKSLYVRYGANLGASVIKIVDDRQRQKVRMEVLHPGKIKEVDFDDAGNVKKVVIEYLRQDDETLSYPEGTLTQPLSYTYTEKIDKETFSTFKDGEPFAYYTDASGKPVDKWDNEYGFVPVVIVPHRDLGLRWGANSYHTILHKIDELNDAASLLNDQVRKAVNLIWYFPGVTAKKDIIVTTDDKDQIPALYGPKDSTNPYPMVFPLNIHDAGENVQSLLEEIERDTPELSLHRVRETGRATAPGVASVYSDATDRIQEARGNYDDGEVRAHQMAIAIGGEMQYEGFLGYNLKSYDRGDLEHYIGERPVIRDMLAKTDRLTALAAIPGTDKLQLEELDYDQETIDEVLAVQDQQTRAAARGLADSIFGAGTNSDTTTQSAQNGANGQPQPQLPTTAVPVQ